jgi:hypothetical protein
MFEFRQKTASATTYDIQGSVFDKDYPKESFDLNDPDNSPIESVLYYCCGIVDECGLFYFGLDCFGHQIQLPIKPELSILLGQIDELISFLRSNSKECSTVDFFEQGYEIKLLFTRAGNNVDVRIELKNNNRLIQGQLEQGMLSVSICRLLLTFIHAVGMLIPSVLNEPAFVKWFTRIVTTNFESISGQSQR